jgi:DNA-directed RNA polymerase subunit RPC12/RpoP
MPIRFRCAYCNQLLGISRRKAGTVVRCPTCAGQVVVPNVETMEPSNGAGNSEPLVFERNDFDELLGSGDRSAVAVPQKELALTSTESPVVIPAPGNPPSGAWGTHAEPALDVFKLNPASGLFPVAAKKEPGIHLSPARAAALAVAVLILLVLAFSAGVWVGFTLRPSSTVPSSKYEPPPRRGRPFPSALARASIPNMLQGAVERGHVERQSGDARQFVIAQA